MVYVLLEINAVKMSRRQNNNSILYTLFRNCKYCKNHNSAP